VVNRLRIGGELGAELEGRMAMHLSLFDGLRVADDAAISGRVLVRDSGLSRWQGYIPGVRSVRGRLEGAFDVQGVLSAPVFTGGLTIRGGEVTFTELSEEYHDISARIDFIGNSMRLTSFSARSGEKGTVYASGTMELRHLRPSSYRVDVTLTDFRVRSIPDFDAEASGTLHVASRDRAGGRVVPMITGKVFVQEATYYWSFASVTGTRAAITLPTADPRWLCNIELSADKNVWVRNPDLNVELQGDLILIRDEEGLYLRGDLTVLRGSYNVYANKFRIIDGTLNFSTAETLRPEVYINAYTPYRTEGGIEKRIYLSLNWPQDEKEPTVQLSYEDPGYYESDLWRMLGGTSLAGGLAANALERALNQQMSGVSIEVDQRRTTGPSQPGTPEQEMMIGVGRYLWEDFYLRYRQGLTFAGEQQFQVEYRISRLFLLRSEFIRNSRRGYIARNGQYTDEFNFDVKLRWEY
jgi:autotransporter translocation and assembly factor TamB